MKKYRLHEKLVLTISISLLIMAILETIILIPVSAEDGIIRVPEEYVTIQAAVNTAFDGDTIQVAAGTYYEHVTIDHKALKLVGEDMSSTIIDGGGTGNVILVTDGTRDVYISGFTIQNGGILDETRGPEHAGIHLRGVRTTIVGNNVSNSGIGILAAGYPLSDNYISNNFITINDFGIILGGVVKGTVTNNNIDFNYRGLLILDSVDCVFKSNTFLNTTRDTFSLERSSNITFQNNRVENSVMGINIGASRSSLIEGNTVLNNDAHGVAIEGSSDITFQNNRVENSGMGINVVNSRKIFIKGNTLSKTISAGIILQEGSNNNVLFNNSISVTEWGLQLGNSNNNIITGNNIFNNRYGEHGIGITLTRSNNNRFYHNNLFYNTEQLNSIDSTNKWDNGAEGNFWGDYTGEDEDNNGIGDTVLPHLEVDYYPLIEPWSPLKDFSVVWEGVTHLVTIFSDSTVAGFEFSQPQKQISFKVTGPPNTQGFCNVTVPIELLDGNFAIIRDSTYISHIKSQNATHSLLYFTFKHGIQRIRIIGTTVIPDTTPPIAIAGDDKIVTVNTVVLFDASSSHDNVRIVNYEWNFGDWINETGVVTTHNYTDLGTYNVTLTVTDSSNNSNTDTITVEVAIDTDLDGTPDVLDEDDDGDGMVDTWELNNGFNPLDATDASADPDGDGLTNLQEHQKDTDPTSYYSPFPIWIAGVTTSAVIIGAIIIYYTRLRSRTQ